MDLIYAALLGLIQGLSEFLPISSSGHLAMTSKLLDIHLPHEIFFDVSLHMGSLLAVLIYFRREIKELLVATTKLLSQLIHPKQFFRLLQKDPPCSLLLFIVIATFITGLIGLLFHDPIIQLFSSSLAIGLGWLGTAAILLVAQWKLRKVSLPCQMRWTHAVWIGLFQALALLPGISRSGTTLMAGLLCGLSRENAFRFTFLLAVPAILMAFLGEGYSIWKNLDQPQIGLIYWVGFVVSALTSYAALSILRWLVLKGQLIPFIIYCSFIGLLTLIFIS